MTYLQRVLLDKPYAIWPVDTNSPYADSGGASRLGEGLTTGNYAFDNTLVAGGGKSLIAATNNNSRFFFPAFKPGRERKPFSLEVWFSPKSSTADVAILSHQVILDGLWWDGNSVHFTTRYNDSSMADASYSLSEIEAVHLVGVHNETDNSLYVNGELVAQVDVSEEQNLSGYDGTTNNDYLYSGYSSATAFIIIDTPAVYGYSLTAAQIGKHFKYGRSVSLISNIVGENTGNYFDFSNSKADLYLSQEWSTTADFAAAEITDVIVSDDSIIPVVDELGVVKAGEWKTSVTLASLDGDTINAARVVWDGDGDFTVWASILDDTSYFQIQNGEPIAGITTNWSLAGKSIDISVRFSAAGDADSVVRSINFSSYRTTTFIGANSSRTGTFTGNAVLSTAENEPIELNASRGLRLFGGSVTIATDQSENTPITGTVELWVKFVTLGAAATLIDARTSGATTKPFIRWTGSAMAQQGFAQTYINGQAQAVGSFTFSTGVWYHIVGVLTTPANDSYRLGRNYLNVEPMTAYVGSVGFYPGSFNSTQVLDIYNSYLGIIANVINDGADITITEHTPGFNIYTFEWAITSAGG